MGTSGVNSVVGTSGINNMHMLHSGRPRGVGWMNIIMMIDGSAGKSGGK